MCDTLKALQLCKPPSRGSLLDPEEGLSTLARADPWLTESSILIKIRQQSRAAYRFA